MEMADAAGMADRATSSPTVCCVCFNDDDLALQDAPKKNNTHTLTYKCVWVQMLQTSWAHIHKLMRVHPGSIVRVSDATVNIIQYALSMLLPPTGGCVREFRCTPNTNRFAGVCVWVGACVRACWRVRMSSNLSGIAITYCTALHAHTHTHIYTVCT